MGANKRNRKKEKLNVINEALDKNILFFGAEDYYKLIST